MQSKNSETLKYFIRFCKANPSLRFWQALRAWSGAKMIMYLHQDKEIGDPAEYSDTFNWHTRDGGWEIEIEDKQLAEWQHEITTMKNKLVEVDRALFEN